MYSPRLLWVRTQTMILGNTNFMAISTRMIKAHDIKTMAGVPIDESSSAVCFCSLDSFCLSSVVEPVDVTWFDHIFQGSVVRTPSAESLEQISPIEHGSSGPVGDGLVGRVVVGKVVGGSTTG